ALSSEVQPHRDEALSRTDLPDRRSDLVRGRSVLQLAERPGRDCEGPMVLRDGPAGERDEVEGILPQLDGLSFADGGGMGLCVPGESGEEPVLRGDGGVTGQVRLVFPEQPGAYLAGRGRKPNDLGWFDMHGSVYTWCQESYKGYPAPKDD